MLALALIALAPQLQDHATHEFELELDPAGVPGEHALTSVELGLGEELPGDLDLESAAWVARVRAGQREAPAQAELLRDRRGRATGLVVRWMEPALGAREKARRVLSLRRGERAAGSPGFRLSALDDAIDLSWEGRRVSRWVTAWDEGRFEETYKPFMHLYGTLGELLTKGPGGTYSHHRGLFLGWTKTTVGTQTTNFWHMPASGRARQVHQSLDEGRCTAGAVFARLVTLTRWITADGEPVVEDTRDTLWWRSGEGGRSWAMDVRVEVRSLQGEVTLGGDPAHAGFQLRAAQSVAKSEACRYLRPASAQERGNDNWSDCPWVVGTFPIGEKHYEVLFMSHAENPAEPLFNTRAYGRFGPFLKGVVRPDHPLRLRYGLLFREQPAGAPLERARADVIYRQYTQPLQARVVD